MPDHISFPPLKKQCVVHVHNETQRLAISTTMENDTIQTLANILRKCQPTTYLYKRERERERESERKKERERNRERGKRKKESVCVREFERKNERRETE